MRILVCTEVEGSLTSSKGGGLRVLGYGLMLNRFGSICEVVLHDRGV